MRVALGLPALQPPTLASTFKGSLRLLNKPLFCLGRLPALAFRRSGFLAFLTRWIELGLFHPSLPALRSGRTGSCRILE
jgi:hypothetical protein